MIFRLLPLTAVALTFAPAMAMAAGAKASINYFSRNNATTVTPELDVNIPVGGFELEAAWAFSRTSVDTPVLDASEFNPLNPYVGARYGLDLALFRLSAGVGLSFPVGRVTSAVDPVTLAHNLGMGGGWNAFLYAPEQFGVVIPAKLDFNVPLLDLSAEGTFYYLLSTGDQSQSTPGLQLAAEGAFPVFALIDLGLRMQFVYFDVTNGNGDLVDLSEAHVSAEPFTQVKLGPARVRLGFLLNITKPLGFSFDSGKAWGLRASAGLDF